MDETKLIDKLAAWNTASELDQEEAALEVERLLGRSFEFLGLRTYAGSQWRIATFEHKRLKIEFVLLPGGEFTAGVSEANRKALAAIDNNVWLPDTVLPPARPVTVKPFVISRLPIDETAANRFPGLMEWRNEFALPPDFPETLGIRHSLLFDWDLVESMLRPHMQMPTELQWEYAYRCGASTLFPWGDALPADQTAWNHILLGDFSDRAVVEAASNAFGVAAMQWGEICSDPFEVGATFGRKPDFETDAHQMPVMRGGSALFEPWKDPSWTMCICGARWDTQDYSLERFAARAVINIPKMKKWRKAKRR